MAKKGGTHHTKRLAIPKVIPVSNKKETKFMITSSPGPHSKSEAIPIRVLLREVLGVAKSASEAKKLLKTRKVLIDGKARTDEAFPVGLMDVVFLKGGDKTYRIVVNRKGKLVPVETKEASKKIAKVIGKRTVAGGKFMAVLHDGRNISIDNNVKVGDSLVISLPEQKVQEVLKFQKGVRCLVTEGKHSGEIAVLEELVAREKSDTEAKLKNHEEFITVAKYLMVIDNSYEGAS